LIGGSGRTDAPAGTAALGALALGKSLSSLFDVSGVYGSFLLTPAGDVAARALPEIVDDATLAEVGGRVVRLGETFQTTGIEPELCVLRFAEHKLYVKTIAGGALCVVTGVDVSMPALRMAANLVARKVGADLARLMTSEPPDGDRDTGAPSASPATRMYRGRPIG
jgi:predicted regulator of Ras-like GTPase activity (Roadblock/LC7/MglB family)